jgi:peptidoglycan/LPS O-acetylase OafA/YrhL
MTIQSLAAYLYTRLETEKPQLLKDLNISAMEKDATPEDDVQPLNVEYSFESSILENRKLYEGLRGVFAAMILFDHFHTAFNVGHRLGTDTTLFVMMSGFTSSLQQLHTVGPNRRAWDWKKFLFSRWVGLFPQLYLAMLITSPRLAMTWHHEVIKRNITPGELVGVLFLYLTGLQMWTPYSKVAYHEQYYGGLIWSVFLVYALCKRILNSSLALGWKLMMYACILGLLALSNVSLRGYRTPATYVLYFGLAMFAGKCYELFHNKFTESQLNFRNNTNAGSFERRLKSFAWTHVPDVLVGIMTFIYAFQGWGEQIYNAFDQFMLVCGLPVLALVLFVLLSLQTGPERSLFTRFICESRLTVLVGECSYPLYLMQYNVVCFWFRIIYSDIKQGTFPLPENFQYDLSWGNSQPIGTKLLYIVASLLVAVLFQKLYQDRLIASLVARSFTGSAQQRTEVKRDEQVDLCPDTSEDREGDIALRNL